MHHPTPTSQFTVYADSLVNYNAIKTTGCAPQKGKAPSTIPFQRSIL